MSNDRKGNFSRNKSFGEGAPPLSPKKGRGGPTRRSKSHDGSKLRSGGTDDDGFAPVGGPKRNSGRGGRGNGSTTPRGRINPTSSFTRPRPSGSKSFNKPRPSGSFKTGRDNPNRLNSSSSSLDGFANDGSGRRDQRRTRSFNKPRPTGSFNAKNNGSFSSFNNDNDSVSGPGSAQQKRELYRRSTSRLTAYDVELFTTGDGKTQGQRSVTRIHVDVLMRARLSNLDPPNFGEDTPGGDSWGPHHKCLWNDPSRREQIEQVMQQYPNAIPLHLKKRTRIVSSKLGDTTAPTLKSSSSVVSEDADNSERDDASSIGNSMMSLGGEPMADISMTFSGQEDMNPLRKTLMILNKLSWTTIGKLTPRLFEVLEQDVPNLIAAPPTSIKTDSNQAAEDNQDNSENSEGNDSKKGSSNVAELSPMVVTILTLIVEKAQTEPHFSAMYAHLCKSLAERNMAWRKKILALCQLEFEHDIAWHTSRLDERLEEKANRSAVMDDNSASSTVTEDMDRDYQILQIRKKYLGHVQFIGELFKLKLIKLDIMIWCLSRLLFNKEEIDEDNLECFAKLMTVVGEQAEALVKKGKCHQVAEEKWYQCWDRIYWLTGRKKKSPGKRQQEQPDGPPPKISSRIKFMLVDLLELEENDWVVRRETEKPKTIDQIHKEVRQEEEEARRRSYSDDWSGSSFGTRRRVNSDDYGRDFSRSPGYDRAKKTVNVDADGFVEVPKKGSSVRRAQSDIDVSDIYNKNSSGSRKKDTPASPAQQPRRSKKPAPKTVAYLDPEECKEKTKNILKEYFIGGDTQDAILSIDELVGAGKDEKSVDRGAAVIEAGVLLVMEMKQEEVQKFLAVIKRCIQNDKIERESLPLGLKDPLEFLSDIEIDAPMARKLLTSIVSYLIRQDALLFNFLLDAPEYFRTDCKAAEFAAGVLKMMGGDPSDEDLAVVEKLMTEDDKKNYRSAKEMVAAEA